MLAVVQAGSGSQRATVRDVAPLKGESMTEAKALNNMLKGINYWIYGKRAELRPKRAIFGVGGADFLVSLCFGYGRYRDAFSMS